MELLSSYIDEILIFNSSKMAPKAFSLAFSAMV